MSMHLTLLLRPADTLRAAAARTGNGAWVLLRRPMLLLVFIGATVSLQASGRLSARLLLDGMVAFAFVPVFELISVAIVHRLNRGRMPISSAVDLFFLTNAPWLLWIVAFDILRAALTSAEAGGVIFAWHMAVPLSALLVAVWTTWIDRAYFREVLGPARADRALVIQRAISWICIGGYFVGHEVWELLAVWIKV
jgi:hypothetical protein